MNNPAKQLEEPEQFTDAQLEETKAWLRTIDKSTEEDVKEEAEQKAALLRRIRTLRQKLTREARRKRCTDARRKEIESELQDLKGIEEQECGTGAPKHPSARRPTAKELGFATDEPTVDEILETATIQHALRLKKLLRASSC